MSPGWGARHKGTGPDQQIKAWVCNRLGTVIVSHLVITTITSGNSSMSTQRWYWKWVSLIRHWPPRPRSLRLSSRRQSRRHLAHISWWKIAHGAFLASQPTALLFSHGWFYLLAVRGMKSLRFSEQGARTPIKLTVPATPPGGLHKADLGCNLNVGFGNRSDRV